MARFYPSWCKEGICNFRLNLNQFSSKWLLNNFNSRYSPDSKLACADNPRLLRSVKTDIFSSHPQHVAVKPQWNSLLRHWLWVEGRPTTMVEDASCVWDCNSDECEMRFKASPWKSSVSLQTPLCKAYGMYRHHSHLVYSYTTQYNRMSHAQVCGVSISPSRLPWNINTTSDRPGIQSALFTVDSKKAMVQQKSASHFKELQSNLLFHQILSVEVAARLRLRRILTFKALKVRITVEHQ